MSKERSDSERFEYDPTNTDFRFKRPKDSEGNNKHYRMKVTIDGKTEYIPVSDDQMVQLFQDWQLGIPGFVVDEPMGSLVMDPSLSQREVALISGALGAYYRAGRLNLDWDDNAPLPGDPGYKEDTYEGGEDNED